MSNPDYPSFSSETFSSHEDLVSFVNDFETNDVNTIVAIVFTSSGPEGANPWVLFYSKST